MNYNLPDESNVIRYFPMANIAENEGDSKSVSLNARRIHWMLKALRPILFIGVGGRDGYSRICE